MKKGPSIYYLIVFFVILIIGTFALFVAGYMHSLFFISIGLILVFLGVVGLCFELKLDNIGKPLTKEQIEKGSCIIVGDIVNFGKAVEPGYAVPVLVVEEQIFSIKLEDGQISLLKELQNLEAGEKYILNYEDEWEKINKISLEERIYEASHQ